MKREIKVGLFAVAVLILGWGVIKYLKGIDVFSKNNVYYANYDQVGGIQPASHVMIYGVKVGTVTNVTLNTDPTKGVEVEMTIDKQYQIPVDSKAKIFSDGLMGGKAVEIVYGTATEMIPNEGTLQTEKSVDLMELAGSEMEGLITKVTVIMDNLTQTLESVNTLMAQNTENITSIVSNVDGLTGNANAMLAQERAHLEEALESLSKFSKSLGDNSEQIESIIGNLNTFSTQLAQSKLVAEVESAVTKLNEVLSAVNDKDGSVGKLLSDGELYENLTEASDNLSVLLADLKENPYRYINVSVFGSNPYKKVERAKAKAEKNAIKRADEAAAKEAKNAQ
ncbi:MAG: MCE family protein [Alistipes sp.]|nr:MCE family protein [Alistipes sp.]